jgi:hypothetical protein
MPILRRMLAQNTRILREREPIKLTVGPLLLFWVLDGCLHAGC